MSRVSPQEKKVSGRPRVKSRKRITIEGSRVSDLLGWTKEGLTDLGVERPLE